MNLEDFSHMKPQCVDTLTNVRQVGEMSDFAQAVDANQRMMMARSILKEWKISDRVDDAIKEVTSIKEEIRSNNFIIKDANDFNNYIKGVLHNISLFN